jgi:heat shock 70kDa protein 1/2/6/8
MSSSSSPFIYPAISQSTDTAFFFRRRLIGRRFDDPTVKKDMESWPFKVIDDGNNNPKVQVEYLGETKSFSPQEISAMVLTKVRWRVHNVTLIVLP